MRDRNSQHGSRRSFAINPWVTVAIGFALLMLLIAAFAAGPITVISMVSGPSATATGQSATGALHPVETVIGIESERVFNDLRSQYLDDRAESITWWLMAAAVSLAFITVFITGLGIIIVIAGFVGYRWFRDILDDARRYTDEAQQSAVQAQSVADVAQITAAKAEQLTEEAEQIVERIRKTEQEAQEIRDTIGGSTAQDAAASQELQRLADQMSNLIEVSDLDRGTAEAIRLQREGNINSAVQKWQAIANLAEGTDNERAARAWFSIGFLHGEAGRREDAVVGYDEAIRLKRNYGEAYNNRGIHKSALGDIESAVVDYNTALQLMPNDAGCLYNRALAYGHLGEHARALEDYDAAIAADPDMSEAYNNRGAQKFALGLLQDAITDYDEAIDRNPDDPKAYNNRGEVEVELGQYDEAIRYCNEALDHDPELAQPYYHRGRARLALGSAIEARTDFEQALELATRTGDSEVEAKATLALADLDS